MRPIPFLRRRHRHGLTLIELVLVVAVLAILAGFIVPRLGLVRNLAGDAGNATTVADATNQSVLYNTVVGHYPDGEDSLLTSANAIGTGINSTLAGELTPLALDNNAAKSLVSQITGNSGGGTINLYAFAGTNNNPNFDDTLDEQITYNSANGVTAGTEVAEITPNAKATAAIYEAAYPSSLLTGNTANGFTPTDGSVLIALGYGQNSAINGKTGLEAPVLFDKVPNEYTRPLFLLKLWDTGNESVPGGTSASTSTGLSYDGTPVSANLSKYGVDQNR